MSDPIELEQVNLKECLAALARGKGVWQPELVQLLSGELEPLKKIWRIDLSGTPDDVRRAVTLNLAALITQLTPRDGKQQRSTEGRRKQYQHCVSVCYNIANYPELKSKSLEDRRKWLAMPERKTLQVADTTSRRELRHAIQAMTERLTSPAYAPVKRNDAVTTPAEATEPSEGKTRDARSATIKSNATSTRSKKRIAVVVAGTIILAAAALVALTTQDSDPCELNDPQCEPVSIQIETDLDRVTPGVPVGAYLFKPATFADLPNKASCGQGYQMQEWAQQHGGRSAFLQYVKVSLTAREKPVLITYAEAVVSKLPSTPGDIASCQDGTQLTVRYLEVDLEKKTTTYYSELDPMTGSTPEPLALRIEPGESEVLIVSVIAASTDATWHLKLGMDVEGHREEQLIQNNGRDFFLGGKDTRGRPVYTKKDANTWSTN